MPAPAVTASDYIARSLRSDLTLKHASELNQRRVHCERQHWNPGVSQDALVLRCNRVTVLFKRCKQPLKDPLCHSFATFAGAVRLLEEIVGCRFSLGRERLTAMQSHRPFVIFGFTCGLAA